MSSSLSPVLKHYLEKVIRDNRVIDARGVMQVNRMIELTLDDVYIDLTVRMGQEDKIIPKPLRAKQSLYLEYASDDTDEPGYDYIYVDDDDEGSEDSDSDILAYKHLIESRPETGVSTSKLLSRHNTWVLLGDPGAGKTTLLKYFAYQSAKDCRTQTGFLPIFVSLRLLAGEWDRQSGWSASDALLNYLEDQGLTEMGYENSEERQELFACFTTALNSGRVLLIFDGLDEQRDIAMQKKSVAAIEALRRRFSGANRFVVSSRIVGYVAAPMGPAFRTATLEPFSDKQMEQFFKQWILAVEKQEDIVADKYTIKRADEKAEQLVNQIKANPGIRALAVNPLLCTIIGLICRQGADLPQMKVELYKLCIDTFIFNWEMHKHRNKDQENSLNKDQTQAVLEELALYFHEHCQENRANRETLIHIAQKFLIEKEALAEAVAKHKAGQLLDLIRDVAGLLIERGHQEYGFFHLTFQEYLTARAITRKKSVMENFLKQYVFKPRWREVMRLAAAHQGSKDEETGSEFIDAIRRQHHEREPIMHYAFRMAFLCMSEARVELDTSDDMVREWVRLFIEKPELRELLLKLWEQPVRKIRYRFGALEPLLAFPLEAESNVRIFVADALGEIGDPIAIPALIEALKDSDENVFWRVSRALGEIGDPIAVPALIEALKDTKTHVRLGASRALGEIGDPIAIPALTETLKDSDDDVRRAAVDALGEIGDPIAIPVLIEALKGAGRTVRWRASRALEKVVGEMNSPALLEAAKHANIYVRRAAVDALGEIGDPIAVPALIETLKDTDIYVYRNASKALGKIGDARAIPALLEGVKHTDRTVRLESIEALGKIGDKIVIPTLLDILRDSDADIRFGASMALGKISDEIVISTLLDALKDSEGDVRLGASRALGEIGDTRAVPALIDALKDSEGDVRLGASRALGEIGDTRAVPALIDALKDSEGDVRWSSIEALGKIGDASVIPTLLDSLKDLKGDVRWAAERTIGNLCDAKAVPALLEAVKDTDMYVSSVAIDTLGKLGDAGAVPELIETLKDTERIVRWRAAMALGEIGDAGAVPALLEAIKDTESFVCSSAAQAIEEIDLDMSI